MVRGREGYKLVGFQWCGLSQELHVCKLLFSFQMSAKPVCGESRLSRGLTSSLGDWACRSSPMAYPPPAVSDQLRGRKATEAREQLCMCNVIFEGYLLRLCPSWGYVEASSCNHVWVSLLVVGLIDVVFGFL